MNRLVANDHDITQMLSAWLHRIRHSTPHTQWHRRYYENAFCIIGVERVWRFGGWHLHKKLLTDSTTSLLPPSETPKCTRPHYPVDLHHERIDCAMDTLGYNVPPLRTSGVIEPNGTTS
jgi:hypothetical protein